MGVLVYEVVFLMDGGWVYIYGCRAGVTKVGRSVRCISSTEWGWRRWFGGYMVVFGVWDTWLRASPAFLFICLFFRAVDFGLSPRFGVGGVYTHMFLFWEGIKRREERREVGEE